MSTYEIWSIVVAAFGSIATFLAVVVALWQIKYANKKKIKLSYTEVATLIQDMSTGKFEKLSYRLSQISITNIGNRKVIITGWGIYFNKDFTLQIVDPNGRKFPIELDIEQSTKITTSLIGIKKAICENREAIGKRINKKMKFVVYDSTGKKHYIKAFKKSSEIVVADDSTYIMKIE